MALARRKETLGETEVEHISAAHFSAISFVLQRSFPRQFSQILFLAAA